MAGSMSKANQRQSQKRKQNSKRYGLKRVRSHIIPMICGKCGQTVELSSADAYKNGGNGCPRCHHKLSFHAAKMKVQLAKV